MTRIALLVPIEAGMTRSERRRRCPVCRRKRVTVSIAVWHPDHEIAGTSEDRCLECWGVRQHDA